MLSAPAPSSDDILDEAVAAAAHLGLVQPNAYVVGGWRWCWRWAGAWLLLLLLLVLALLVLVLVLVLALALVLGRLHHTHPDHTPHTAGRCAWSASTTPTAPR